jgi:hypothetical protein
MADPDVPTTTKPITILEQQNIALAKEQEEIEAQKSIYEQEQTKLSQIQQQYKHPIRGVNIAYERPYQQQFEKVQQQYKTLSSGIEQYNVGVEALKTQSEQVQSEISKLNLSPKSTEDITFAESLYEKGYITPEEFTSYKTTALENIASEKQYQADIQASYPDRINIHTSTYTDSSGAKYIRYWSDKAPNGNFAEGSFRIETKRGVVEYTPEQIQEQIVSNTTKYLGINRWDIAGQEHTTPPGSFPGEGLIPLQQREALKQQTTAELHQRRADLMAGFQGFALEKGQVATPLQIEMEDLAKAPIGSIVDARRFNISRGATEDDLAKIEYLQSGKEWGSEKAFEEALAGVEEKEFFVTPRAIILQSTPEQRLAEKRYFEQSGLGGMEYEKFLLEPPVQEGYLPHFTPFVGTGELTPEQRAKLKKVEAEPSVVTEEQKNLLRRFLSGKDTSGISESELKSLMSPVYKKMGIDPNKIPDIKLTTKELSSRAKGKFGVEMMILGMNYDEYLKEYPETIPGRMPSKAVISAKLSPEETLRTASHELSHGIYKESGEDVAVTGESKFLEEFNKYYGTNIGKSDYIFGDVRAGGTISRITETAKDIIFGGELKPYVIGQLTSKTPLETKTTLIEEYKYKPTTKQLESKITESNIVNKEGQIILTPEESIKYESSLKNQPDSVGSGISFYKYTQADKEKNALIETIGKDKYNKATEIIQNRKFESSYKESKGKLDLFGAAISPLTDIGITAKTWETIYEYKYGDKEKAKQLSKELTISEAERMTELGGMIERREILPSYSPTLKMTPEQMKLYEEGKFSPEPEGLKLGLVTDVSLRSPVTAFVPIGVGAKVGTVALEKSLIYGASKVGAKGVAEKLGTTYGKTFLIGTKEFTLAGAPIELAAGAVFTGAIALDVASSKTIGEAVGKVAVLGAGLPGAALGYKLPGKTIELSKSGISEAKEIGKFTLEKAEPIIQSKPSIFIQEKTPDFIKESPILFKTQEIIKGERFIPELIVGDVPLTNELTNILPRLSKKRQIKVQSLANVLEYAKTTPTEQMKPLDFTKTKYGGKIGKELELKMKKEKSVMGGSATLGVYIKPGEFRVSEGGLAKDFDTYFERIKEAPKEILKISQEKYPRAKFKQTKGKMKTIIQESGESIVDIHPLSEIRVGEQINPKIYFKGSVFREPIKISGIKYRDPIDIMQSKAEGTIQFLKGEARIEESAPQREKDIQDITDFFSSRIRAGERRMLKLSGKAKIIEEKNIARAKQDLESFKLHSGYPIEEIGYRSGYELIKSGAALPLFLGTRPVSKVEKTEYYDVTGRKTDYYPTETKEVVKIVGDYYPSKPIKVTTKQPTGYYPSGGKKVTPTGYYEPTKPKEKPLGYYEPTKPKEPRGYYPVLSTDYYPPEYIPPKEKYPAPPTKEKGKPEEFFKPERKPIDDKKEQKSKETTAYKYKFRASPIFEAPTTLYTEKSVNPLKTSVKPSRRTKTIEKGKSKPVLDLGSSDIKNPIERIISKKKHKKNVNKKEFWSV